MAYETILYEVSDNILTITLNRRERLNAFTLVMQRELIEAFDRADADDAVRASNVTGSGVRSARARILRPAARPSTRARAATGRRRAPGLMARRI